MKKGGPKYIPLGYGKNALPFRQNTVVKRMNSTYINWTISIISVFKNFRCCCSLFTGRGKPGEVGRGRTETPIFRLILLSKEIWSPFCGVTEARC